MSKKLFVRLLVALSFLVAAVFFLLSALEVEPFTDFSASWAGVIFAGISGIALLFSAIGTKNSVQLKKLQIALSAALLAVAALCLVGYRLQPEHYAGGRLPSESYLFFVAFAAAFFVFSTAPHSPRLIRFRSWLGRLARGLYRYDVADLLNCLTRQRKPDESENP